MARFADIGPVLKIDFGLTGGVCSLAVWFGGGGGGCCGCCCGGACATCCCACGCCCTGGAAGCGRPAREASRSFFNSSRLSCGCFEEAMRFLSESLFVSGGLTLRLSGGASTKVM